MLDCPEWHKRTDVQQNVCASKKEENKKTKQRVNGTFSCMMNALPDITTPERKQMQTNSRLSRFTVQATCIQCRVLPKLIRFMTDGALQSHCGIWKQAAFQQFSYLGFMCTSFRVRFKVQISSGRNPWHSKWNYAIGECETLNWSLPEFPYCISRSENIFASISHVGVHANLPADILPTVFTANKMNPGINTFAGYSSMIFTRSWHRCRRGLVVASAFRLAWNNITCHNIFMTREELLPLNDFIIKSGQRCRTQRLTSRKLGCCNVGLAIKDSDVSFYSPPGSCCSGNNTNFNQKSNFNSFNTFNGETFVGLSLTEVDANRAVKETAVSAIEGILSRRTIHQKQHSS